MSEVWLIDEASGPVQLHRSAIVTALDEPAAPARRGRRHGDAHRTRDGKEPIANAAAAFFTRTNTCTPLGPSAPPTPMTRACMHRHSRSHSSRLGIDLIAGLLCHTYRFLTRTIPARWRTDRCRMT